MIIMSNRRCGTPKSGIYAVGTLSSSGTLHPFTALAAPLEAEITNPRAAEKVHIAETLTSGFGLVPPDGHDRSRFAGLPVVALADLWGMNAYPTVWDVIEETMRKGIARRIPKVPNVSLPCPVLMMHMRAVIEADRHAGRRAATQFVRKSVAWPDTSWAEIVEQPWVTAESLGRVGNPTYLDHPHVTFWRLWQEHIAGQPQSYVRHEMKRMNIELGQGIFGIGWINSFVQVLRNDQDRVDTKLAEQGVLPALSPHDPRALQMCQELMQI